MTKRIFYSICLVAISVFLASLGLIMGVLYKYFSTVQLEQLKVQTTLAAKGVQDAGADYFTSLDTGDYRITWIDSEGSVLYDTVTDSSTMENHLEREEIQSAITDGYGESIRYSDTLTKKLLYTAEKLPDGSFVRLSAEQYTVWILLLNLMQPIIIVAFIAAAMSLVLAFRLSKKIVRPLNELNLDEPQTNKGYEEIRPLLEHISAQQSQLKRQAAKLQRQQGEFEAVTDNMNEGLVLLNVQGMIISINRTAAKFLSVSKDCIGRDILLLNNSIELQELLSKAKSGSHAEASVSLNGTECQINASPVFSNGEVTGIVLLIFDITERAQAEQMRREFTANVSHELKTPLHSISGYAELLKNQMVKPEDVPMFAGQIYTQVQYMIALVDDIIRLSHLDEGAADLKREKVDLYTVAQDTVKNLQPAADRHAITVSLVGESAVVDGDEQLLSGIIYNLCDNAVKYNRENGSVSVEIKKAEKEIILSVSDTGIGIPEEHKNRIFERFYRVDKSHSKEVGGTGLGLSIVKHSARLHNASIEVAGVANGGTIVTVRFPAPK